MKLLSTIFSLLLILGLSINMSKAQHNTLTEEEQREGWILLFDGESLDHWRGYNSGTFPEEGWVAEDGALTVLEDGGGGDIITRHKYGDFVLKLEWKVQERGNSGIFYRGIEQPNQPIYWSAPEFQILDDENHPDAEMGEDGNRKSASLYDLIPADPQNSNPYGEWNSAKIVAKGSTIEHWQNGEKVVSYEMWTNEWYEMIRNSKFSEHPEFGDPREGHVGLQDHGDRVSFRNIKIKEL
jgi:hypothetical protein